MPNPVTMQSSAGLEFIKHRRSVQQERELARHRGERDVNEKISESNERRLKILRSLLVTGSSDHMFSGFNNNKWVTRAECDPDGWTWVKSKYGVIGVPYPDNEEYSFPPNTAFPVKNELLAYIKDTMKGEVREL